jgi:hypothetical protein
MEKKKPLKEKKRSNQEEPEIKTSEGFDDNESPDQRPKDPPGTGG